MSLLKQKVRAYERQVIAEAIQAAGGRVKPAAWALGVSFQALYRRLAAHQTDGHALDDEPLAWAIRRDGDRVTLGACWTRDDIAAEAVSVTTVAVVLDHAQAIFLTRDINTKLAIEGAVRTASVGPSCRSFV